MRKKASNKFTHLDKILFPKSSITKKDVINYYSSVAKRILPLIKNRPIMMHRFPNGIHKKGFFQKNIPSSFPSWIKTKEIPLVKGKHSKMLICNDRKTLLYLANLGCIAIHIWLSTIKNLEKPDRMVFDLDPPGGNFSLVREGALALKKILDKHSLKSTLMTTGSKGLHVIVSLPAKKKFPEVREFAKKIATILVKQDPTKYTVQQRISKRGKRLFIDFLRNSYGQTTIAPYSLRAIEKAPIAMPISWKELSKVNSKSFTIKNKKK